MMLQQVNMDIKNISSKQITKALTLAYFYVQQIQFFSIWKIYKSHKTEIKITLFFEMALTNPKHIL